MTHINSSLLIIGGGNAKRSYEMLEIDNDIQWKSGSLTFDIRDHCSASIDSSTVIITGGELNGKVIKV